MGVPLASEQDFFCPPRVANCDLMNILAKKIRGLLARVMPNIVRQRFCIAFICTFVILVS